LTVKKIGKYEIVEELGRGGMGLVYRAYDSLMDRDVAIKVIQDVALDVPEIKSRFYREARTAGKLSHDNITIVHDVGEEDGRPYIVMEYLTGSDLRSIMDRNEPISLIQKIEIAIQVCNGLSFSHSRDIIHRDIKPANIRVLDGRRVKIMDFGIAKPTSSQLTSTGAVIGTPFYMSPEQIQGKKIDKRSDIFSTGVLFYELLTHRKPFSGDEPTAVMYKIVHEQPEHFDEFEKIVPPRLREVVVRLLHKDPNKRFQDLSDCAAELEAILVELKSGDKRKSDDVRKKVDKFITESRTLLNKLKFKQASEAAEKAAAIDPGNSQVMQVLNAIHDAEAAETRKGEIRDRLQSAKKLLAAQQYDAAIEALEGVLQIDRNEPEARKLLDTAREAHLGQLAAEAKAALGNNDLTGAERLARQILQVKEQDPAAKTILEAVSDRRLSKEELADQPTQFVEATPVPPSAQAPPPPVQETVIVPTPTPLPGRGPIPEPAHRTGTQIQKKKPPVVLLAAAGGLLVVALVVGWFLTRSPAASTGYVSVTVLPWAEVTLVQDRTGKAVALTERQYTPCRLALPEGAYNIQLSNPSSDKPLVVSVDVKQGQTVAVVKKMPGFDSRKAMSAF
jgi:serine/threonine protein kinase